jgi:hypothetical protein
MTPAQILALGIAPPGTQDKLNTILGWVTYVAAWSAGVAFIVTGAMFCYAFFSGTNSHSMKQLGGICAGCIIISAAAGISNALLV